MAQPDITLTFASLKLHVARVKYGATTSTEYAALTAGQKAECADIANCGLLDFLSSHPWSFLAPRTSFTLWATQSSTASGAPVYDDGTSTVTAETAMFYPSMVGKSVTFGATGKSYVIASYTSSTIVVVTGNASGEADEDAITVTADGDYLLPDDFGQLLSPPVYEPDTCALRLVARTNAEIDILRSQSDDAGGYATDFCIAPVEFSETAGQQHNLRVWPTPGTTANVMLHMLLVPGKLEDDADNLPGGVLHSLTIRDAALAENEIRTGLVNGQFFNRYRGLDRQGTLLPQSSLGRSIRLDALNTPLVSGGRISRSAPYDVALLDTSSFWP